ncbi:Clp protease N-terminal domain-containing protein [Saccharomonospora xinjiangensis]|uniref:Clp amino terminal domain-containing protein n=1 Tax=Saccharomonospora xinjiangensis XJ-54 TaxID=882086 RepID=I0V7T6_9PSEU|nr:Clp protease N-terminal domain-containing protein [Saccharomonospora xinjiangensis]EID56189.1 Clp amino terminal domain-containing protein [Saccharomonospora xinjiangensis XJ-54]
MAKNMPTIRLDDLIEAIKNARSDVLEQLSDAVMLAEHLGEVSDHLIGHFVDQARRSGASWTDIGKSMGVSKQAVQKRFVNKAGPLDPAEGFQRFTPRARSAVMAAQEEARAAGNPTIAPAHLALGLLNDPVSLAVVILGEQGVSTEAMRQAVTSALPERQSEVPDLIPYDQDARKVLELTFRQALRMGHNYIGTEHILLALLDAEDGAGPLSGLGLTKEAVERAVAAHLEAMVGSAQDSDSGSGSA